MTTETVQRVITEAQIEAIIDDCVKQLEDILDDPMDGVEPDYYEDEYGHCYNSGSNNIGGELEGICVDGLPGINNEEADIYIFAEYDGDCSWYDDYDSGDYWTPPSGGIEVTKAEVWLTSIDIDICVYNEETDEYDDIEVPEDVKKRIIDEVNQKVAA